jgi:GNAT superfamily N-acetyltransferase
MGRHHPRLAVTVELFQAARAELLPLFAQADDSPAEIATYIHLGDVLVARHGSGIVGHVQLVAANTDCEIKSIAVVDAHQGQGIGAALVYAALDRAFSAGASRVLVATATADIGNLRFYQRLGFRMERVQRDVFTVERGYANLQVDGIPVRDQVWFSMPRPAAGGAVSTDETSG